MDGGLDERSCLPATRQNVSDATEATGLCQEQQQPPRPPYQHQWQYWSACGEATPRSGLDESGALRRKRPAVYDAAHAQRQSGFGAQRRDFAGAVVRASFGRRRGCRVFQKCLAFTYKCLIPKKNRCLFRLRAMFVSDTSPPKPVCLTGISQLLDPPPLHLRPRPKKPDTGT